jgi:hypothetical protein
MAKEIGPKEAWLRAVREAEWHRAIPRSGAKIRAVDAMIDLADVKKASEMGGKEGNLADAGSVALGGAEGVRGLPVRALSPEALKAYNRERQRLSRARKKEAKK